MGLDGMGNVLRHSCVTIAFDVDGKKHEYSYGASRVQAMVARNQKTNQKSIGILHNTDNPERCVVTHILL